MIPGDLVFGDSIGETVAAIIGMAIRENTAGSWDEAQHKIDGIAMLLQILRGRGDAHVYSIIALTNHATTCYRMAREPASRKRLDALAMSL